jgi:hypothetical protein
VTDRYGEAIWAAVESDGMATTRAIKTELGIGYNEAAKFTERMVADGIISEANSVGRRTILKNFCGLCEPCGAPLFEDDEYATDDNGCTACLPAFHDDLPDGRPCYAHRVGGLSAACAVGDSRDAQPPSGD